MKWSWSFLLECIEYGLAIFLSDTCFCFWDVLLLLGDFWVLFSFHSLLSFYSPFPSLLGLFETRGKRERRKRMVWSSLLGEICTFYLSIKDGLGMFLNFFTWECQRTDFVIVISLSKSS